MTTREFLAYMQRYYGMAYSADGDGPAVAQYLESKTPLYRTELARITLLHHSKKWRCLPDIAILEEYASEVRDAVASALSNRSLPAPSPGDHAIIRDYGPEIEACFAKLKSVVHIDGTNGHKEKEERREKLMRQAEMLQREKVSKT